MMAGEVDATLHGFLIGVSSLYVGLQPGGTTVHVDLVHGEAVDQILRQLVLPQRASSWPLE